MSTAQIATGLTELYETYFPDDPVEERKNALAASDSVDAIERLCGRQLGTVVDVGAGDGVVTAEIHRRGLAQSIHAMEISSSGLAKIDARKLAGVTATRFDGYSIPARDDQFDLAVCSHVLEHVEYERLFIQEVSRVARQSIFIVPLEGGMRGKIDRRMGHINYYTPMHARNLIETAGQKVEDEYVYPCSLAYEQHVSGQPVGRIKNLIRNSVLRLAGPVAPHLLVYIMALRCAKARY